MFIAALFIITKAWKQLIGPCVNAVSEWINKMWYIQTMEYYSALKIKELSSHEKTQRNFKNILLSERRQSENTKYHKIPTTQYSGKGKSKETVKKSVQGNLSAVYLVIQYGTMVQKCSEILSFEVTSRPGNNVSIHSNFC